MTPDEPLAGLPRRAVAAFAARAARRVLPRAARAAGKYGPEAWEWLNAADATVRAVEAFARGWPVTRFTLDLAAELPRAAANAMATAARRLGPSPVVEQAELAFAAAAFAADAARAITPARAAHMARQAVNTATAADPSLGRLTAFDATVLTGLGLGPADSDGPPVDPSDAGPLGELWPAGEPDGWADAWAELANRAAVLPRLVLVKNESGQPDHT